MKRGKVETRYKILLLDDQNAVYTALQAALPVEKYEVIPVFRSDILLHHFKNGYVPDLIVLDVYMPGGGFERGLKMAKIIREQFLLPTMREQLKMFEIPIIVYSNFAYWIDHSDLLEEKTAREKEYKRLRKEFREVAVYDFIDKNMTKEGEPNPDSIGTLALRIESYLCDLTRNTD